MGSVENLLMIIDKFSNPIPSHPPLKAAALPIASSAIGQAIEDFTTALTELSPSDTE
jgi:hypothetical protein